MVQQQVQQYQYQQQEQTVIEKLEQAVPQYNPQSEQFDKALVDETIALKNAYIQQQYAPPDALERAAMAAMQMHQISMGNAATQAKSPTPDPKSVERNLAAAQQQPPVVPPGTTAGAGAAEVDVMALSDEDLASLPAATQARLRGDIV